VGLFFVYFASAFFFHFHSHTHTHTHTLSHKSLLKNHTLHLIRVILFSAPDEPDSSKIVSVVANDGKTGESRELSYTNYKVIGNGSFGVVFQAKLVDTGELTAIKKVLQDKRFKVISFLLLSFPSSCCFKYTTHGFQKLESGTANNAARLTS
jgi:hypothetical protein